MVVQASKIYLREDEKTATMAKGSLSIIVFFLISRYMKTVVGASSDIRLITLFTNKQH